MSKHPEKTVREQRTEEFQAKNRRRREERDRLSRGEYQRLRALRRACKGASGTDDKPGTTAPS